MSGGFDQGFWGTQARNGLFIPVLLGRCVIVIAVGFPPRRAVSRAHLPPACVCSAFVAVWDIPVCKPPSSLGKERKNGDVGGKEKRIVNLESDIMLNFIPFRQIDGICNDGKHDREADGDSAAWNQGSKIYPDIIYLILIYSLSL